MNNLQKDTYMTWLAFAVAIAFIIGLLLVGTCNAQTVSFSPTSMNLWGQLDHTAKLSVEYKNFELIVLGSTKETRRLIYKGEQKGNYGGVFLGIFYKPLNFDFKGFNFKGGAVY